MSVEAMTDALHEYMYEKLNESLETEEENRIRYMDRRKFKNSQEQTERFSKTRRLNCNKVGAPNRSEQHKCPTRGKNA